MNIKPATCCIALLLLCACQRATPVADPATRVEHANASTVADEAPRAAEPSHPVIAERWILPGDFGPGTTLQELQQRFGASNVVPGEVPGAEGETFRGVVLFPEDPSRRATLYFQDTQNLHGLSMISVDDAGSRWELASGIRIGTTLADLQARNGKPFTFTGFDWDYGGTITDWQGGKLQPADDEIASERMQLRMPEGGSSEKPYPMGDAEFKSDDPRWKDLGISVGGISVGFPGEDDPS